VKGWHKESYRHYLAGKGILTKRYMKWKYDYSGGWPGNRYKIKLANPNDLQLIESEKEKSKSKIQDIADSGDILEPVRVFNKYTSDQKYQVIDGHHRVLAAIKRGDTQIPIEVVDYPEYREDSRRRQGLPAHKDSSKETNYVLAGRKEVNK